MLTNDQMKASRFLRLHSARKRLAWIEAQWAEGKTVYVSTMTRHTQFKPKWAGRDMFRATKGGLYMRQGRGWVCIDGCGLSARLEGKLKKVA